MYDDKELGTELRRLVEADPLGPIDARDLLARGRRGRRRRQVLSVGGVTAVVGAVAVAAATLPGLAGDDSGRAVVGDQASVSPSTTRPTARATAAPKTSLPVAPKASLRVAPDADTAAVLRACSVKLRWIADGRPDDSGGPDSGEPKPAATDLTGWRVPVRAIQPRVGTSFVATSPDEKMVAHCVLYAPGVPRGYDGASDTSSWAWNPHRLPERRALSPFLFGAGVGCASDLACKGFLYTGVEQVPARVTRIRATATNGQFVDLYPRDGWLAVMWADGGRARFGLKYRAYDAQGKEVKADMALYQKEAQEEAEADRESRPPASR